MLSPGLPKSADHFWHRWPVAARIILPIFLLFSGVSLLSRGLIVRRYIHDAYVLFDGEWRASLGQVAHIDFRSAIGQAYYWPFALLGVLGDHDVLTIIHANILIAALLAAGMAASLVRRLSPGLLGLATVAILAMAMAPRDIDYLITNYSYLAPYNRWCWAMLMLVALIALLPPVRVRPLIDGTVLGVLIGLLAYIKLNYLAGAIAIVIPALILGHLKPKTALVALVVVMAMTGVIEAIWHNGGAYLADIRMALVSGIETPGKSRFTNIIRSLPPATCYAAVVLGIFRASRPPSGLRSEWKPILTAIGVILVGAAVSIQNHAKFEYGHGVTAVIIALEYVRRRKAEGGEPLFGSRAIVTLVCAGMLITAADAASIFTHAAETWTGRVCPVPALRGTQGARLLEPPREIAGIDEAARPPACDKLQALPLTAPPATEVNRLEMQRLDQAMTMLRDKGRTGDVILAFDFGNPYPFLLAAPPAQGALTWWDEGRNFGPKAHPDPGPMLQSATLVLQLTGGSEKFVASGKGAWDIYGPEVIRLYDPIAETPTLRLWRRRGTG